MPRRPTGQPAGRPPGKNYPIRRNMLLTEQDEATLIRLAAAWACSTTEAVRRLIREAGKRLDRTGRRQAKGGE
jgi:hypothetical protein